MDGKKRSRDSSDMDNLVKALQEKEELLEYMYKKEKILVDRIKSQHERCLSDVHNYEDKLSEKDKEIETLEMMRFLEKADRDQLLVLKERNLSLCKAKLDQTQDELDDLKASFDIFTPNQNLEGCSNSEDECRLLEAEILKQKHEFAQLAFGKRCEVSSLEVSFAWSEFKRIESGFTEELMRKEEEIKEANKTISSLQEQLQASNHEKEKFMSKVAELENNASKKKVKKISRLMCEVKPLRRSERIKKLMSKVAELEDNASKKKVKKISRLMCEVKPLRRSERLKKSMHNKFIYA